MSGHQSAQYVWLTEAVSSPTLTPHPSVSRSLSVGMLRMIICCYSYLIYIIITYNIICMVYDGL